MDGSNAWEDQRRLQAMLQRLPSGRSRPSPQITAQEGPTDSRGIAVVVDGTEYVQHLEQQVAELRRQLTASHDIRTSFATDIEAQHKNHQEIVISLQASLQLESAKWTALVAKLQKENADLLAQNLALQTRVTELMKTVDDLKRQLMDQQKANEARNAAIQNQLIQQRNENHLLQQRLDKMDARNLLADWISVFYEAVVAEVNQHTGKTFADYAALCRAESTLKRAGDDSLTRAKENAAVKLGLSEDQWAAVRVFKGDRNRLIHDDNFDVKDAKEAVSTLELVGTNRDALLAIIRIVDQL